jgi:hypothetical protein
MTTTGFRVWIIGYPRCAAMSAAPGAGRTKLRHNSHAVALLLEDPADLT